MVLTAETAVLRNDLAWRVPWLRARKHEPLRADARQHGYASVAMAPGPSKGRAQTACDTATAAMLRESAALRPPA